LVEYLNQEIQEQAFNWLRDRLTKVGLKLFHYLSNINRLHIHMELLRIIQESKVGHLVNINL